MLSDKEDFLRAGFDVSFLDKIVQDFKEDTPIVLGLISEYHRLGFGVPWIMDLVQTAGPAGIKFMQDLLGAFGIGSATMAEAQAHELAKVVGAAPEARPFIDWLRANGPALLSLVLKLLLGGAIPLAKPPE